MNKAYDIKVLGQMIIEEAKKDGLTIAEEAAEKLAKAAYVGSKKWFAQSAAMTDTKADDLVAGIYNMADPVVMPMIEAMVDGDGKQS